MFISFFELAPLRRRAYSDQELDDEAMLVGRLPGSPKAQHGLHRSKLTDLAICSSAPI